MLVSASKGDIAAMKLRALGLMARVEALHRECDVQNVRFDRWFSGWRGKTPWGSWLAGRALARGHAHLEESTRLFDELIVAMEELVAADQGRS
jgi:hypothetical protein